MTGIQTINAIPCAACALALTLLAGCGPKPGPPQPDPLAIALAPQPGDSPADQEIRRFQDRVRRGIQRAASIERLGWANVAKARESFDPGYYTIAQACARALDAASPGCAEGLLLRGHVLANLHRFAEAEALARELVTRRGAPFDYLLLGDALMEQGNLDEAIPACQKAIDLRPDLQSFSRAAHLRWLTGDLDGAIEMMQRAVGASSPLDAESRAWACSRLAAWQFQAGVADLAARTCDAALKARPDYPPALLLRGRMLLASGDARQAVIVLERAANENPLPDYQWTLADALRAAGRETQAVAVEERLRATGERADPRTFALYLATRGDDPARAVRLAKMELDQRRDVLTRDALAWALCAAGRGDEARREIERALEEGTEEARLYFHAAVIADRTGRTGEAREWADAAGELSQCLLPSEREQLRALQGQLTATKAAATRPGPAVPATTEPRFGRKTGTTTRHERSLRAMVASLPHFAEPPDRAVAASLCDAPAQGVANRRPAWGRPQGGSHSPGSRPRCRSRRSASRGGGRSPARPGPAVPATGQSASNTFPLPALAGDGLRNPNQEETK